MKKNRFIKLNVAFRPPKEIREKAISLSRKISKSYKTFFILDDNKFFPHITIYSVDYPMVNYENVLKEVEKISLKSSKIIFKLKEIDHFYGYIGIVSQLTPEIKKLHKNIIKQLNYLREGHIRDKYLQGNYSAKQKKNIKQYGSPEVINLYNPHLTITRLKNSQQTKEAIKNIKWEDRKFIIDKIAIYLSSGHGTCIKLIKEFNLE